MTTEQAFTLIGTDQGRRRTGTNVPLSTFVTDHGWAQQVKLLTMLKDIKIAAIKVGSILQSNFETVGIMRLWPWEFVAWPGEAATFHTHFTIAAAESRANRLCTRRVNG